MNIKKEKAENIYNIERLILTCKPKINPNFGTLYLKKSKIQIESNIDCYDVICIIYS